MTIEISDNGSGYPKDLIGRIGEPYISTRNKEKKESGGGLGLGLFIAKTLLERSGASIEFSNGKDEVLKGAHVKIVWPRAHLEKQMKSFSARHSELKQ